MLMVFEFLFVLAIFVQLDTTSKVICSKVVLAFQSFICIICGCFDRWFRLYPYQEKIRVVPPCLHKRGKRVPQVA
jgi:hypothetical protein